jgi:hypothetical protein
VKRIISLDEDISQCSNNAAFVITVATVRTRLPICHLYVLSNTP